jgi:hypothetical protein
MPNQDSMINSWTAKERKGEENLISFILEEIAKGIKDDFIKKHGGHEPFTHYSNSWAKPISSNKTLWISINDNGFIKIYGEFAWAASPLKHEIYKTYEIANPDFTIEGVADDFVSIFEKLKNGKTVDFEYSDA